MTDVSEETPLLMADSNDRGEGENALDETVTGPIVPRDADAGSALLLTVVLNILFLSVSICITTVKYHSGMEIINHMNGFLCVLLWTATSCIIYQYVTMWRHRHNVYVKSGAELNRFLLNITVFLFMPLTQTYLLTRIAKNVFLVECLPASEMLKTVSQMLFVAAVSGHILTLSGKKIIGTKSQVRLCRGTIISVVTTSVCLWMQLLFMEAKHNYYNSVNATYRHTLNCNVSEYNSGGANIMEITELYLMPFMIEFLLAASVLLYVPYQTAARMGPIENNLPTLEGPSYANHRDILDGTERTMQHNPEVNCKPCPVIVGGCFLILCLFSLILNIPYGSHKSQLINAGLLAFNIGSYFTLTLCIACSIMLYIQIRRYPECAWKSPAERILLWISACGIFLECITYIYCAAHVLHAENTEHMKLSLIKYILRFVQVISQSIVLDVSLHRSFHGQEPILRSSQPALILLLINFGMWGDAVYFQYNWVDTIECFNQYTDLVLESLYQPLHVLYRIHCVAMLYQLCKDLG